MTIVAKHCHGLEQLNLSCMDNITDKTLTVVAHYCADLASLTTSSRKFTDTSTLLIVENCKNLEYLSVSDVLTQTKPKKKRHVALHRLFLATTCSRSFSRQSISFLATLELRYLQGIGMPDDVCEIPFFQTVGILKCTPVSAD